MAEAVAAGADAFFDEKYGERVRTIRVEGYSHELCGGTHCRASGQIGGFIITGERSIGSGMRRIEAVTGEAAEALAEERFGLLESATVAAGAQSPEQLVARIEELKARGRESRKGSSLPDAVAAARAAEALARGRFVAFAGTFGSMDELKSWARQVREGLGSGIIAAGLEDPEEPQLFVTVSDDLVAQGLHAGDLVRDALTESGGKGGGRPQMAQGRLLRARDLPEAMQRLRERLGG